MNKVIVLDNTLRDGEQQPLINFNKKQKIILAKAIRAVGVDFIDLMPIANKQEQEIVKELSNMPLVLSTPLRDEAIDLSLSLKKNILVFQAVSDILLKKRYKKGPLDEIKKENIRRFRSLLRKIKKINKKIKLFAVGEDSSRAEMDYLLRLANSISEYIDGFFIADSVGYLIPEKVEELIKKLRKKCACPIGIHAHNDLGLADENTIRAVLAGAKIISGTFTGIGERAGNANLGNVLFKLRDIGIELRQIKYEKIKEVEALVRKYAKRGPAKPFSKEAFYVESGIHVHALLNDPRGYSLIDPKLLGYEYKVFFSKKSGISNFKWYLGNKYSDEEYSDFRDKIKEISIKKNKSFTFEEVKKILNIK